MLMHPKSLKGRRIVDCYQEPDGLTVLLLDDPGHQKALPPLALSIWQDEEQNGPGALVAHDTDTGEQYLVHNNAERKSA